MKPILEKSLERVYAFLEYTARIIMTILLPIKALKTIDSQHSTILFWQRQYEHTAVELKRQKDHAVNVFTAMREAAKIAGYEVILKPVFLETPDGAHQPVTFTCQIRAGDDVVVQHESDTREKAILAALTELNAQRQTDKP